MSVEITTVAIAIGNFQVPQEDVITCKIHLGATKEVSSFDLVLQNWGKKYSPNGWLPIVIGSTGGIGLCRAPNNPTQVPIISLRVESAEYDSSSTESYVHVSGRCWGEKLFRRTVTKTYANAKGEAIVKDLLDNFAGLSHNRNGVELVENTDTTYVNLDYQDTAVWDILTYIAGSADKNGVIGFDFRIAPDGKFEFFPKNSKVSSVNLSELLENTKYSLDISSVRNKITVYGIADKSYPLDQDGATEALTNPFGTWTGTATLSASSTHKKLGTYSICTTISNWSGANLQFFYSSAVNANLFTDFNFSLCIVGTDFTGGFSVAFYDTNGKTAYREFSTAVVNAFDNFRDFKYGVGYKNQSDWIAQSGFDWTKIIYVYFDFWVKNISSSGSVYLDAMFFGGCRYSSVQEDASSQATYGLREYTETDEELGSDNECSLRAQALLTHYSSPVENLVVDSTVIDYGTSPLLAADNIHATLPNENVDEDFRTDYIEYSFDADTQTLQIMLSLGHEKPLLADYIYALRSKLKQVSKYKISK